MVPSKGSFVLRVLDADQWPLWRGLRLEALAESPYAFGSKLADWQAAGDTEQRWRDRLSSVPFNVVAVLDDVPVGMVSGTPADDSDAIELISMWVAQSARGRGVGDALVRAVIEWAASQSAKRVQLDVVKTNQHAIRLYERHGFVYVGEVEDEATGVSESRMSLSVSFGPR